MKKRLTLALTTSVQMFISTVLLAHTAIDNNGLEWTYTRLSNGEISIGSGDTSNPLAIDITTQGDIRIPIRLPVTQSGGQVTCIDWAAFRDCADLTSVYIPPTVTNIKNQAFRGCTSLASINIPSHVQNIGRWLFDGCHNLKAIFIPDAVTNIEEGAFLNCTSLKRVEIPNGVVSIGQNAFYGCTSITRATVSQSVLDMRLYNVFSAAYQSIEKVDIANEVTNVSALAFKDCTAMRNVTFPDTIKEFGVDAFRNCIHLSSVTIPESAKKFHMYAFGGCSGLQQVYISNLDKWCNTSFANGEANPLYYAHNLYVNGESASTLPMSDGLTDIASYAFYGCTNIVNIAVPNSVTNIGTCAFDGYITPNRAVTFLGNVPNGTESSKIVESAEKVYYRQRYSDSFAGIVSEEKFGGYLPVIVSAYANENDFSTGGDSEWNSPSSFNSPTPVKSGRLFNNQISWLETTISTPGQISFWWKSSSEEYDGEVFDYAYLSIDGVPQGRVFFDENSERNILEGIAIGGKTGWTNVVIDVVGEGTHTIRWTYCKDEMDEADVGEDCVWLDEFSFTPRPTISFDIGASTNGDAPDSIHEFTETDITLPNDDGFSWPDHVFDGWTDGISDYDTKASFTIPSSNVTFIAKWIAKSFLTFDIGGGEGSTPMLIKALPSTIVSLPTDGGFAWTDHVFDGWTDGANDYAGGANYAVPSSNVTLTAKWITKSFVSFDIGKGTGDVPETIKDIPNAVIELPTDNGFSWADHVFIGWDFGNWTYEIGTAEWNNFAVPSSNVTLTAHWLAKSFVSFDIGDGTGERPQMIKALPDAIVSLPTGEGLALTDYALGGWTDGTANYAAGDNYIVPETNVTLTAVWIAKRFLTFMLAGGEGEIPITIKDIPNATVTLPNGEGLSKTKYTFVGWSDGTQTYEAGAEYVVTDSSIEFSAVWAANTLAAPVITSADVANGGTIETESATIEISAEDGTTIYYTMDGTEPTTNSIPYTVPFTADGLSVTIKAFAIKDNYFDSGVAEFSFYRKPYSAAECLNADGKTVSTGGNDTAWVRVLGEAAHDGVAALRSGEIGDGESSSIEMTVDGAGEISFWWKSSSEISRNRKFDYVSFLIDDVEHSWLGGEKGWTNEVHAVSGEGTHTLKWIYQKNNNGLTQGEDCAWLDEVEWIATTPVVTWEITFDANGGLIDDWEVVRYVEMEDGMTFADAIGDLPAPERLGYDFKGWFTEKNGGTQIYGTTTAIADVTYYAHWEENEDGCVVDGTRWFYQDCGELDGIEIIGIAGTIPSLLVIPTALDGKTVVAISAYWGEAQHTSLDGVVSLTLNEGLKRIGRGAFEGCQFRSVYIPSTLETVECFAFADCPNLATVSISEGVCALNECALSGCTSLCEIEMPSTITNLERAIFQECMSLTNVTFKGAQPTLISSVVYDEEWDNLFWQVPTNTTTIYVMDAKGWKDENGDRLSAWCGRPVVFDPIPDIGDEPTAEDIAEALEGSTDERLATHITGKNAYMAYREWMNHVCGFNFEKRQAVKDSAHAWLSFALDVNALIVIPPKQGDLKIDKFKPSETNGAFDFEILVEDIAIGEGASAANLAEIFGIEGSSTLNGDYSSDAVELSFGTPTNGKVKCTARPKDATKPSFFMKVRMTP